FNLSIHSSLTEVLNCLTRPVFRKVRLSISKERKFSVVSTGGEPKSLIFFGLIGGSFSLTWFSLFLLSKFHQYRQSADCSQAISQPALLLIDCPFKNLLNLFRTCRLWERQSCFFLSKRGLSQAIISF